MQAIADTFKEEMAYQQKSVAAVMEQQSEKYEELTEATNKTINEGLEFIVKTVEGQKLLEQQTQTFASEIEEVRKTVAKYLDFTNRLERKIKPPSYSFTVFLLFFLSLCLGAAAAWLYGKDFFNWILSYM